MRLERRRGRQCCGSGGSTREKYPPLPVATVMRRGARHGFVVLFGVILGLHDGGADAMLLLAARPVPLGCAPLCAGVAGQGCRAGFPCSGGRGARLLGPAARLPGDPPLGGQARALGESGGGPGVEVCVWHADFWSAAAATLCSPTCWCSSSTCSWWCGPSVGWAGAVHAALSSHVAGGPYVAARRGLLLQPVTRRAGGLRAALGA